MSIPAPLGNRRSWKRVSVLDGNTILRELLRLLAAMNYVEKTSWARRRRNVINNQYDIVRTFGTRVVVEYVNKAGIHLSPGRCPGDVGNTLEESPLTPDTTFI